MRSNDTPHLLTLKQVAQACSVSRRTVAYWVASGRLPTVRVGSRSPRVLESDFREFISLLRSGADKS